MADSRIDMWLRQREQNWQLINEEDAAAKAAGKLVGRYIKEGIADGYAIYKIVRENRKTVRIKVVTDIGDDWIIPYWGSETSIDKAFAEANIRRRDSFAEIFGRKGKARDGNADNSGK